MEKKSLINLVILAIIMVSLIFLIIKYVNLEESEKNECVQIESLIKAKYESCFDLSSKEIFLFIEREDDSSSLKEIELIFNDNS